MTAPDRARACLEQLRSGGLVLVIDAATVPTALKLLQSLRGQGCWVLDPRR